MWMSVYLIMEAVSTRVRTQPALINASVALETGWLRTDTHAFVSTEVDLQLMSRENQTDHVNISFVFSVALERAVEELSSPVVVERPLVHLTLLQDYPQSLERYNDYEEDGFGELRAESTISEKFGVLLNLFTWQEL